MGGQKTDNLGCMKISWMLLGVTAKLDYILGSYLFILGSFLKVNVSEWEILF